MLFDIYNKDIGQLYSTPIVQQTAFWSKVKNQLGASTIAVNFKTKNPELFGCPRGVFAITSDILAIIKYIGYDRCIAYVPYGPELMPYEEHRGAFLEELSECIREYLPKGCILIRYDLCWESPWAMDAESFDTNGNWLGEPEPYAQELRLNFNTINKNLYKAQSNILPTSTIYLDLQKSTDEILTSMKPKTRYNIGLAARKGVKVRTLGIDNLEVWYKLYKETATRNNILLNDMRYFEAVLTANADSTVSPAKVLLLAAEHQGTPLAAMFLIISDNRASYLYGASSSENRNLMATYALQWEAISIAKAAGCTEYDMFGVAPAPIPSHPLYGLYKFKVGFGGHIFHSMGCWDYPLNFDLYQQFNAMELNSQGYHLS